MMLWLARVLLFIPISIFHPTKIYGKKNIPKGRAILSCNHRSNWDIVLYYLNTNKRLKILAKKELFKNKPFGWLLKCFGGVPIEREANDINAIKECMRILKKEQKLCIFPEGTRLKDDSQILGEIKGGISLLSIKTKTPIVPIWIESRPKNFHKSVYHIGKPFELSQFYGCKLDEKTLTEADKIVRDKMLEVREEVENAKLQKQSKKQQK